MKKPASNSQQAQQHLIDFLQQALPTNAVELLESLSNKQYNDQRSQQHVSELESIQNMLSNQYQKCLIQAEQQTQMNQRLQALAHGLWLDTTQPLMWCLCGLGESVDQFCLSGQPVSHGFRTAKIACEALDFAGFQDWRLPSIHQLKRLHRQTLPRLFLTQRMPDVSIWSATDNTKSTKNNGTGAWLWQQGKAVLHPRKSDRFFVLAMRRVKASDQPFLNH